MPGELEIEVGGTAEHDAAAFIDTWERPSRGQHVKPTRVLSFESWEGLARVMTGERYRLLRHLHAHPEPSISALARGLGRHLRRVQADVHALEEAGLIERENGIVRTTADRLSAEFRL